MCPFQFISSLLVLQFTSLVSDDMDLDTVLSGNTDFVGWNVFCSGQGYSSADCEDAAVVIASSFEINVRASKQQSQSCCGNGAVEP